MISATALDLLAFVTWVFFYAERNTSFFKCLCLILCRPFSNGLEPRLITKTGSLSGIADGEVKTLNTSFFLLAPFYCSLSILKCHLVTRTHFTCIT
ncbi:hypothetical protein RND81_05G009300 [Saponaria officinalis]|uniref:Secreted protein n=1 Tax=Saponaria officinalis TaxID=3572 RepID=A0AAW1KWF5_SAPOF